MKFDVYVVDARGCEFDFIGVIPMQTYITKSYQEEVFFMMRENVRELFEGFECLDMTTQITGVCEELDKNKIERIERHFRKRTLEFYMGENAVFALIPTSNRLERQFGLMDRELYDKYFAECKGSLSLVKREKGDYKIEAYIPGQQLTLHQLMMQEAGCDLDEIDAVDHKFGSPLINTREAVRAATRSQNRGNTRFLHGRVRGTKMLKDTLTSKDFDRFVDKERAKYGEYAYDPLVDFTNTWYAYVLYKMLGICEFDDLKVYNIAYIERYEPDVARYYKKLLAV